MKPQDENTAPDLQNPKTGGTEAPNPDTPALEPVSLQAAFSLQADPVQPDGPLLVSHDDAYQLRALMQQQQTAAMQLKEARRLMAAAMQERGMTEYVDNVWGLRVSLSSAATQRVLDTERLKAERPKVYQQYCRERSVAATVKLYIF